MTRTLIYPVCSTAACNYACELLSDWGFQLTDHPAPEITHLLLDVPSFQTDTKLRNGGDPELLLSMLPPHITVAGGNLSHPLLNTYRKMDLLQDPQYLASNAAITADCALKIAAPMIQSTFADTPSLILGWGRIGKCLAQLLKGLNCPVTVAARKEEDRALLHAMGYDTTEFTGLSHRLHRYRLLFNTVPAPILNTDQMQFSKQCVKIELASVNGIIGPNITIARGLPGTYAPESSGKLIANSFYRLWREQSI